MSPYTPTSLRSVYKERHHVLLAVHQTLQLRLEPAQRLLRISRPFLLRSRGIRTPGLPSRAPEAAPGVAMTPSPRNSLECPRSAGEASRRSGKTKRRRSAPSRPPSDRSITAGWRLAVAGIRRKVAGIATGSEKGRKVELGRAQNPGCDAKREVPGNEGKTEWRPIR